MIAPGKTGGCRTGQPRFVRRVQGDASKCEQSSGARTSTVRLAHGLALAGCGADDGSQSPTTTEARPQRPKPRRQRPKPRPPAPSSNSASKTSRNKRRRSTSGRRTRRTRPSATRSRSRRKRSKSRSTPSTSSFTKPVVASGTWGSVQTPAPACARANQAPHPATATLAGRPPIYLKIPEVEFES